MFKAILFTQWKWTRLAIVPGAIVAFWIPLMSVQRASLAFGSRSDALYHTRDVLSGVETWSVSYPLLAGLLAMITAAAAWSPDLHGRHVYALSLPVPRWYYTLLRLGAGAALLALPVIAVGLGALIATSVAVIPAGTQAHPWALTIRFGLALAVAYAVFFAITTSSQRTTKYIAGAVAGIILLQVLLMTTLEVDVLGHVAQWALQWPGPLQIFTGRWMLIDV